MGFLVVPTYNLVIRNLQMEDILQQVSNDHRSIYFAVQLKLMDLTQSIKLMGASFKENQLKTVLSDMINHSYMLEAIFEEAKIPHIYQLVKAIAINFNSITALLLEKLEKTAQREAALLQVINSHHSQENSGGKNGECVMGNGSLMKEIKKNRLGGIHLFNQNYTRYIEDQKILEQIQSQKQKRLQRKRMDILRESILQELSHQTDVEEFPANSDDIANYIIQAKDKNSMFNYVSYQPELQDVLGFFQKSQQQANEFLMKKMRNIGEQEGQFSFADFQRDILNKNSQLRRQVVEKMSSFTDKYRSKEKQMEDYINQKESAFKQAERRRMQRCDKQTETQINFDQYLQSFDKQIKDLTQKCCSLENMSKQHFHNNDKQNQLKRELVEKQAEIDKLIKKIAELELSIESVKQLLKDQRIKKIGSVKQIDYKSQRAIPQPAPFVEKQRKLYVPPKQKSPQSRVLLQDKASVQSNDIQMNSTFTANESQKKKEMSSSASFLSFHDVDRDRNGRQTLRPQKKITTKYYQTKRSNHQDTKLSEIDSKQAEPLAKQRLEEKSSVKFQDKVMQIPKNTQKLNQKQQAKGSAQGAMEPRAKSNNTSNKQSSVSTPKQSSKAIDIQTIKKSLKMIPENANSTTKIVKTTTPTLKKIKMDQRQNNTSSPSSGSIPIRQIKSQDPMRQKQNIQPSATLDNKNQPIKAPQALSQIPIQQQDQSVILQSSKRCENKKQIAPFEMYEVTEEDAEQQTAKPSAVNSNQSSMKSFPAKQKELLGKLNAELKKLANQKNLAFSHLYNLTIIPQKQLNTEHHSIMGRTSTEESQNTLQKDKTHRKVMKLFDNLLQNEGSFSQSKSQKLKRWRKAMLNSLKSQAISQDQVEQILSIIRGSSLNKNHPSIYQNAVSSIASVSLHIRNSLPEIQQITNLSNISIKSKLPNLKKIKPRQRIQDNQDKTIKEDSRCILLTQFQQQMEELITHQSLQNNFHQKFHNLHKHCDEGALCTHVTKYFQSIMRHYEEAKKKERRSIALPVQNIGVKSKLQEDALSKFLKPLQHNKSLRIDKAYDKGAINRNYSLTKHRYSQQIILPSIKESKFNNGSSSALKHVL